MEHPRAAVALPLAVAIGFVAWFTMSHEASREPSRSGGVDASGEADDDPSAPLTIADNPAPSPNAVDATTPAPVTSAEREKRDEMRALLWKSFGHAEPAAPSTAAATYTLPESVPPPPGIEEKLEPKYIQSHVHEEFFPVARQCYGDALKRVPGLAGEIDLYFTIVGNKNIGGVVESVDVLNKSTLRDPEMIECIRESFLATTFPPPESGGYVTVEYPIIFSPDDDEAGAD